MDFICFCVLWLKNKILAEYTNHTQKVIECITLKKSDGIKNMVMETE